MKQLNTENFIDSRNEKLWNELNNKYKIEIIRFKKPYSETFSQNDNVKIYINPKTITAASFTHELLHLWIRKKEIYIGASINLWAQEKPNIKKVFSDNLLLHIGNTLEHVKMFPEFINLGFKSNEFLHDNEVHKCTDRELKRIRKNYKYSIGYNASAVDTFIGKFFAISADHNENFNYKSCHSELKDIDDSLYEILNQFWREWIEYDMEKEDSIYNSYHDIAFNFTSNYEDWTENKVII